jgi:hypothetical protein
VAAAEHGDNSRFDCSIDASVLLGTVGAAVRLTYIRVRSVAIDGHAALAVVVERAPRRRRGVCNRSTTTAGAGS